MRKKILFFILTFSSLANAQYFEGFENGVPGTMNQSYNMGETTWIDFGISAIYVERPLSDTNSAVFFNGMATSEVATSLETPVLDLSSPQARLEFKYLQKERTVGYHNDLIVELSNDLGKTWLTIGIYKETFETMRKVHIDLAPFKPTKTSIIRFKSTQLKVDKGYPIVIDDIDIANDSTTSTNEMDKNHTSSEVGLYPNPSAGNFNINTNHPVDITILDINGKVVFSKNQITSENQINLTSFQKGIYLAKIIDNGTEHIQKIILN